jgi:cytosine permease
MALPSGREPSASRDRILSKINWWQDALRRLDAVADGHSTSPVPDEQTVPALRIAVVCIAISFTLTGLYAGAALADSLGLATGVRSVLIGSAILAVMSIPAAIIGARTRLSTYMIVVTVFGASGARLVNFVLAAVLLGWYAVTAELFGRTCFVTMQGYGVTLAPQWVYTIGCSVLVIATTIFGFRAIDRLSLAVAPLLVALTGYVAWRALQHTSWNTLWAIAGHHVNLSTGISAVIGGLIVNVVLMPDITRYARTAVDCAVISVTGNGIGGGAALILAMLPALAFHELDPMKYMLLLGLVGIAFGTLVVSTWTINAVNLYSTGLVTSTALPGVNYARIVIACGIVGTILGLIGIADRLIDFLVLLGLIVPPIAAIYITDFFVLNRRDYSPSAHRPYGRVNFNGLIGCAVGGGIGLGMYFTDTSLTGVPAIESFLSAAMFYAIAEFTRSRVRRNIA